MFSRQIPLLFVFSLATLLTPSLVPAEEPKTGQQALKAFLQAFGDAELKAMQKLYAPKVTVYKGSRLLDEKYGGLGGEDGTKKTKKVKREALIAAYETTIEKLGGKDDWQERGKKLKTFEIQYITENSPNAEKYFSYVGAQKTDVLAIVNPKGDSMFFHLRKIDGEWRIIGEVWS